MHGSIGPLTVAGQARGDGEVEALLQRLADAVDNGAWHVPAGASWALWVALLILPGSFPLLPVLLWRRKARSPSRSRRRASIGQPAQPMRGGRKRPPCRCARRSLSSRSSAETPSLPVLHQRG
jgi:hypothetical protein